MGDAEAGARLVGVRGYADMTFRTTAIEAGVTKTTVEHHFMDKARLVGAVEDIIVDEEQRCVDMPLESRVQGDRDALTARFELLVRAAHLTKPHAQAKAVLATARGGAARAGPHAAVLAAALDGIALHGLLDADFDVAAAVDLLRRAVVAPRGRARRGRARRR